MLGKTLNSIIILHIFLTCVGRVSTQDVEVSIELDTKEESKLQLIGSEQLNQEDAGNEQLNEENVRNEQLLEEGAENEPLNEEEAENEQPKEEGADNQQLNEESAGNEQLNEKNDYSKKVHQDKQLKKVNKPVLWKLNDAPEKKQELGFDLTPEEMKKFKIWKDGVIPYYIDVVSYSDKVLRDMIRNYLHMVNAITGLNFMELPSPPSNEDERWVFFMNRRSLLGCADHTVKNFSNQGVQHVVLGYDCIATKGELPEAVMSIVGIPSQHNAPDRDKYITVNMENIMPDKKYLFDKLRDNEWLFHDLEYDFDSVTHYDIHKYSVNGRVTIELKKDSKDLNPAKALSPTDILKIKMLYNYITGNKKLQVPECQKLFKPPNKNDRFVAAHKPIKPRKKPSRYTGLADNDKGKNDEAVELAERGEEQDEANIEENEEENEQKLNGDEEQLGDKNNEKGEGYMQKLKEKKKVISKIDALALLSDYETD